jgi:hypothetical protein
MMRLLIAAALLCAGFGGALAQRVSKVDGQRLLKICSAENPVLEQCDIYLSGVADGMGLQPADSRQACIPIKVTGKQLREVVLKVLHGHPEKLQLPAADIATHAFMESFPCKK